MAKRSPLAVLPLATVLRTLVTSTISSSRLLLPPSLAVMTLLAHSNNAILNPERNRLLNWFLKKTFYAQYCAGENAAEVKATLAGLNKIGFTGVILNYAREVVLTESQSKNLTPCDTGAEAEECIRNEINPWLKATLATVQIAQPHDFVALKFTGAGRQALYALRNRLPPPKALASAIDEICELAAARNVPLLFDAEQTALQGGIDDWTIDYARKYNSLVPNHALIYGTYQSYLKHCPSLLSEHLAIAAKEKFTLGVKLVRGAYLGADPRHLIHDTKEDTDRCCDGISEALITRKWNDVLQPPAAKKGQDARGAEFPPVSVVLGTHNLETVQKAQALHASPDAAGVELAIAQLMGMADEVSCALIAGNKEEQAAAAAAANAKPVVEKTTASTATTTRVGIDASVGGGQDTKAKAYKYIVWGTTKECMTYLLRRAHENKDAVSRTKAGRDAMWEETKRRFWGVFGSSA
ncbi:FAD-linked oxidoreductase-like protein [Microdochium trichocladiopsis]|uniref:Proline dehydrogenase n=1 Tax=Microdochium trichocladiopsis TaxID=1682393 RepID=A0A9P8YD48_9PEZI|nr:FAD-linked oxidoreductase-like protein [Microdochium trichocladiopsis]KAH7034632.1 FAD-linked oxidoreductase-like protein [Microdochium trichocladiopsis]